MASSLLAHSPRFRSQIVDLATLRTYPDPIALGPRHKPINHALLVDTIHAEIASRSYTVVKEQLAIGAKGGALFGVMDLQTANSTALMPSQDRSLSFGFRNSVNSSLALRAVAGNKVFVCDNLVMSGDMFAIKRKNTRFLDLVSAIRNGFDKFIKQSLTLSLHIARLQETYITDSAAKEKVFDVFASRIIPVRLFDDVEQFYFHPTDDMTDCAPRSLWGLHNAFTRAMKSLNPTRMFQATVALGAAFNMTSQSVIDVQAIDVQ